MGGDQDKSGDKKRVSDGRTFMKDYNPPSKYKQRMNKLQGDLSVCKDRVDQLERSGGKPERIEQAKREKEKISLQREVEYCKVALDDDLSPEHRLGVEEYLEQLRADLKDAGGVEL